MVIFHSYVSLPEGRSMKDDLMIQIRWKSQVLYKRLMENCVRIREFAGEESQSLS